MGTSRRSARAFACIIVGVLVLRVALTVFPVDHPQARQSLLHWKEIVLLAGMGFAAVRLAPRAGFPDLCDTRVGTMARFVLPVALGAGFGVLTICESLLHQWPNFHVPFPQSIFVYGSASVLYELKYHAVPIVLVVWLAYDLGVGARWGNAVFWVAAIFLSLYEPLNQLPNMVRMEMISVPMHVHSHARGPSPRPGLWLCR